MLLKCCSVMVKKLTTIFQFILLFFFFTYAHTYAQHTSFMSFSIRYFFLKKEPCCIRLYNWHNSSNKMLRKRPNYLYTQYIEYLSRNLPCLLFVLVLLIVRVCLFLFFIRAFSTYFIMDDPLSKLGNHSSQLHNLQSYTRVQ